MSLSVPPELSTSQKAEAARMDGSSTMASESQPCKIWRSETSVKIPSADILSFAFANLGQYDQNKPIFVDANDASSYISAREARATIRKLVKGFKEHGLQEGDRVCLVAYNNMSWPILWLAIIGCGGVAVGTNPSYTSSELAHHFNVAGPKYCIVQSECLQAVEAAIAACNIPPPHIFTLCGANQTSPEGKQPWQSLTLYGECEWDTNTIHHKSIADKPAALNSTSGTTGLPKAAVVTHCFVVAQTSMVEQRFKNKPYQSSQLVCLPVFHAFAAQIALVLPLRLGITTYLLPRYNARDFSRIVNTLQITETAVVPPIVTSLLRLPEEEQRALKSLRYVLCAGAPITPTLQAVLCQHLSPDAVVAQVWGTTEVGWASMFNWNEKDLSGSVGRLQPGIELKLVNDGLPVDEDLIQGEAYIRSPSMFTHYLDNPSATATAFDSDGFYGTGDRAYMHEGKIFIEGRVKDTLKIKGWQVSPSEIEAVLLEHPMIVDAAVVGIPAIDEDGLETTLPRAYVVPNMVSPAILPGLPVMQPIPPGVPQPLTAQEVVDFAASKLIPYKKLTGGVIFIDKIPRNATGKILRRLLCQPDEPDSPAFRSDASIALSASDASGDIPPLEGSEG